MTQAELARRCEVSEPTVTNWLNGKRTPSYKRIVSIADVCGISVAQLVGELPRVEERETLPEPVGTSHSIADAPAPGDEDESELPNEAA